jgi:hypothetical protein
MQQLVYDLPFFVCCDGSSVNVLRLCFCCFSKVLSCNSRELDLVLQQQPFCSNVVFYGLCLSSLPLFLCSPSLCLYFVCCILEAHSKVIGFFQGFSPSLQFCFFLRERETKFDIRYSFVLLRVWTEEYGSDDYL